MVEIIKGIPRLFKMRVRQRGLGVMWPGLKMAALHRHLYKNYISFGGSREVWASDWGYSSPPGYAPGNNYENIDNLLIKYVKCKYQHVYFYIWPGWRKVIYSHAANKIVQHNRGCNRHLRHFMIRVSTVKIKRLINVILVLKDGWYRFV